MPLLLLLLDDDDLSREVLTLLLREDGFAVEAFASGDAALAYLTEAERPDYDAVLTDLQMPGLQGAELAGELRSCLRPGTPIVVMSGSTPPPASLAAFDEFLLKPLTSHDLADCLARLLAGEPTGSSAELTTTATANADRAADRASGGAAAPLQPAPDQPPALDEVTFSNLAALMQPAQLRDLLALSMRETDRYLGELRQSLGRGDHAATRAAAHALKGGVAMIGARELHGLAANLETLSAPATRNPAYQAATLNQIEAAAKRLRRMLVSRGIGPLSVPASANEDTIE